MVSSAAILFIITLWTFLFGHSSVFCQDLRERDALCNAEGCYVVYFQRKTFLDSWKACKGKGGNLATIKRRDDANTIATLFSTVDLRYSRTKVQVWIGLQRQPRQCTNTRPLRGFSWTTGDQDTEHTDWLKEDSPSTCTVPRCVAMGYNIQEPTDNFKWLDGSCSVPVEGYLCYYDYQQMCHALSSEGPGSVLYNTPFNLMSTLLTHVPFGSVAIVPCPGDTAKKETILCMLQDNGVAGWSKNPPICADVPLQYNWCDDDNGGCEHFCKQTGDQFFCECASGYQLSQDGQSCELLDACQGTPCEYECLPLSDGYRCACPEGYMLATDERRCVDVDECLQSPCEQLCVNAPGTFECRCRDGYQPGEESECEDIDECNNDPCEHACENTHGSHVCHCHLGYSLLPGDSSRCQDIDECQIPGTCDQMCVNYVGGFECYCKEGYTLMADLYSCQKIEKRDDQYDVTPPSLWVTHQPDPAWDTEDYEWNPQQSHTNWPAEVDQSLDWLTDPPKLLDSDVIWVTSAPQEEGLFNQALNFPTEGATEFEEGTDHLYTDWFQREQHVQPEEEVLATTISSMSPSSPSSSTTSDFYEEEEETTTAPPLLPTSTISEGAWHWWAALTTNATLYSVPTESSPSQASSGTGTGSSNDVDSVQNKSQNQNSTWLLVGLLVPICIFVVVMVALGIVYCTRCALQPRNKNATDCYHWISGAHDKQGARNPSAGVKTNV